MEHERVVGRHGGVVLLVLALVWSLFGVQAPVGTTYIAVLACVGIVVTIWPPTSRWPKVGWILFFLAITVLEIRSIYHERDESQRRQSEAIKSQQDGFAEVITKQQSAFVALLGQFAETLKQGKDLNNLAQETLLNITGAGSVPRIVPQVFGGGEPIPLYMWNGGKHLLTGVVATIHHSTDLGPSYFSKQQEIIVGIVHPGFGRLLNQGIMPSPDPSGIDTWNIEISTQSDTFTEVLSFRRNAVSGGWAYRYVIYKHSIVKEPTRRSPTSKAISAPVFVSDGWSDEPIAAKR